MAITVKHNKVSTIPDGSDTDLIRPSDWNADHSLSGVGTMAEQDASNVAITGGSINGTSLGATTAASAKVTTLDIGMGLTLATSAGTAGQVLTSAGAGNVPVWSTNGAGDVVGPASSTDNAITRFDSTTGKLIQNSVVTLSDTGDIAGATTITDINYVDFNTGYATALGAGQLGWDGNNTLGLGMTANVTQEIGLQTYIYGKASSAITKGQLVQKTGAVGASGVVLVAPTSANLTDSQPIIGIAAEDIALNGFGFIVAFGNLKGLNTTGASVGETWADGDTLYYNPSGNGTFTKNKPSAPNIKCEVAIITHAASGGAGSVAIKIINGSQLGGTDSNVQLSSPTGGQLLTYSSVDTYWKNTSLGAGTGISVNSATNGVITVTNTAPDQVVALSAGTGISTSGTYPNFTITNTAPDQVVAISAGTGISTSGTYPNFTVTNTAPDQVVAISAGTGMAVTGTYPNFTVAVVNGVFTTGSYSNPSWITSLDGSKIDGTLDGGTF